MKENLKKYLLENEDELMSVVSEINGYDGSFEHLEVFTNDEDFFDNYFVKPHDAVRAVYYGEYNYTDDYVKFNGYGNLESTSEYEYLEDLKGEVGDIVDAVIEMQGRIFVSDEIEEILEDNE